MREVGGSGEGGEGGAPVRVHSAGKLSACTMSLTAAHSATCMMLSQRMHGASSRSLLQKGAPLCESQLMLLPRKAAASLCQQPSPQAT